MLPRTQGIALEPAPQASAIKLCDQPLRNSVLAIESRDQRSPLRCGSSRASASLSEALEVHVCAFSRVPIEPSPS
jgi:hypothetical protein